VAWAFSIYLEAIAIAPQLIMLTRRGGVENLTSWYVFALGAYRALYVANWVLRWATEPGYTAWIAWVAGAVQTALYADFFYYFVRAKYYGKDLVLPT
jgi:ER lumen protein retaining receptor